MYAKYIHLLIALLEDTWCVYKKPQCAQVKAIEATGRAEGTANGRECI
jgi:hypothetical protein